ncbi:GT2 family glycosyltransferase [Actinokineospora baliensis]|uniref:glycosyltransferase family 2 protein n=1 Tax=Actinokineospora baliensis TaxID=547056 RepID=UPI0027DBDA9C|nr:glycosyltransferase family 2 protein [Actinokineospora baliensis]MBM7770048.1 GT2 family glycosyltransferase [Actinokineospora baliensis]
MPPRSRSALARGGPVLRTAPVLAVLVCHDGAEWLRPALSALRRSSPRPRHVIAVDTGSTDDTAALLDAASRGPDQVVDGVLTLDPATGFADAVHAAVEHAVERWGDPGGWIWLLHDDCAPDPDCLATLLLAAEVSPSAGVLGPLVVDWQDPRLVVEAGLSTDASGHRQTGVGPSELDWVRLGRGADRTAFEQTAFEQTTEVLAVSSAGMLVRRAVWDEVGGFDRALRLYGEDIDLGWRANQAGHVVLCVPTSRIRHARAVSTRRRRVDAGSPRLGSTPRALARGAGLRTFLVNCSALSFLVGVPRLTLLCLVRALGFAMQRRLADARAELRAVAYLLGGGAGLRAARAERARRGKRSGSVRGLFTSRSTRLRNATRGAVSTMVRRRVAADAALGRLPSDYDPAAVWLPPDSVPRPPVSPDVLPAGAGGRPRRAGLRRPEKAIAVPLVIEAGEQPSGLRPSPGPRPSPVRRDGTTPVPAEMVLVRVDRGRVLRQIALAPPLLLVLGLVALAFAVNAGRLGLDLAGGRLSPIGSLEQVWSEYLATWHGVAGGTAAPAPTALAVLGSLGAVFAPVGGPQVVVALLFLADLPLAGLSAYVATRRAPVRRWVRALLALGYALLPPAAAAVAQGRLDAVVVHILLPLVASGIAALIGRYRVGEGTWLSTAAGTALGVAAIGAFSPLTHLTLVAMALGGFVLVPGGGARRGAALFLLVLMPLALLLPWPAVVIQHPGVVLHGLGSVVDAPAASLVDLASLNAGGPGAWSFVGFVVVAAVLVGIAAGARRAVLPGLAFALLGVATVVLVRLVPATPLSGGPAVPAWTGVPLLIVGWGLVWALLGALRTGRARVRWPAVLAGAAAVGVLAIGVIIPGRQGPLDDTGGERLATTLTAELANTNRSVLVLSDHAPRQATGRAPLFGDDDLAPTPSAGPRLAGLDRELRSGDTDRVRTAVLRAAASGVLFVVIPMAEADVFRDRAGTLVADAPQTSAGSAVFRLLPRSGSAYLLSPDVAHQALTGGTPPSDGAVPVAAAPPQVAVRVSDGAEGRLLVITAEEEPGWQATVDGRPVAVVRAWGSSVAVTVPTRAAEVRIEQPTTLRGLLLLIQAAVVLFALLTAIPGRRGQDSPSITPGSRPR